MENTLEELKTRIETIEKQLRKTEMLLWPQTQKMIQSMRRSFYEHREIRKLLLSRCQLFEPELFFRVYYQIPLTEENMKEIPYMKKDGITLVLTPNYFEWRQKSLQASLPITQGDLKLSIDTLIKNRHKLVEWMGMVKIILNVSTRTLIQAMTLPEDDFFECKETRNVIVENWDEWSQFYMPQSADNDLGVRQILSLPKLEWNDIPLTEFDKPTM